MVLLHKYQAVSSIAVSIQRFSFISNKYMMLIIIISFIDILDQVDVLYKTIKASPFLSLWWAPIMFQRCAKPPTITNPVWLWRWPQVHTLYTSIIYFCINSFLIIIIIIITSIDAGDINNVLFADLYQGLKWTFFAIIIMSFLHTFGNIVFIAFFDKFEFDLHTLTLALAFISVIRKLTKNIYGNTVKLDHYSFINTDIVTLATFPMEYENIICQYIYIYI